MSVNNNPMSQQQQILLQQQQQQQLLLQQQHANMNRQPSYGVYPAPNRNTISPNQNLSNYQMKQSPTMQMYQPNPGTGGSNAQGRAINKMLLDILRGRIIDPNRLSLIVDANIERMDCVNLATLLFHTGKKRLLLTPLFIKRIAARFNTLKEELRAREASNSLYGLKCMSSESPEVRQLILALANKISSSSTDLVAQAVGNALYGCQMMTSDHEEVRYLLQVLANKVSQCVEPLEAQNVGNALYGLRGMNSDAKEVRQLLAALTPKVATAKEDLNGQALGNSLYGLQGMSAKEIEVRNLLSVLSDKINHCWEDLKAQEVGNALYGLKRMSSDVPELRMLIDALVPKIAASPEILDAQAIGNSFYGMQNMKSDNKTVLSLLSTMAQKVSMSVAELDGQAMGNSLYGLQGMSSECEEVREVIRAITSKLELSSLDMNAQELGNSLYGLQNMTSGYVEVRTLLVALARKVASSKHDLTSQEIGNALFGLQGMKSDTWETRLLLRQIGVKIAKSTALLDPQGIANSLYGFQRMSSECTEVKQIIQALAIKIDQSWKLLNAQHIANALYGLQNLSSFELEVSELLRSLVPKITTCRDEMTSKQISCAMFGLQSFYSSNDEVKSILVALTEKISTSKDVMTGLQFGSALFGLQGCDTSSIEVRNLLKAFVERIDGNIKELDILSLGNAFFGIQRMSTVDSMEFIELLRILHGLLLSLVDSGIELTANVCSSIFYGLQNCSVTINYVNDILMITGNRTKEITNYYINNFKNYYYNFNDMLCIYQSLSLMLLNLLDLDYHKILSELLYELQSILTHIVESRRDEYLSIRKQLTIPQQRICEGMKILLTNEPFTSTSNELLWGFESTCFVSINPDIQLTTANNELFQPTLNIEILGTSHTFPAKDLYTRLRNRFLFEQKGVIVEMIHASVVGSGKVGQGIHAKKTIVNTLRNQEHLLDCLCPRTSEDASSFANQLSIYYNLPNHPGILSSIYHSTPDQLIESYNAKKGLLENNTIKSKHYFVNGALDSSTDLTIDCFDSSLGYDYLDDDYDDDSVRSTLNPNTNRSNGLSISPTNESISLNDIYINDARASRGMRFHWLGDHPKLSSPTSARTPSPRSSTPNTKVGNSVFSFSFIQSNSTTSKPYSKGPSISSTIVPPVVPINIPNSNYVNTKPSVDLSISNNTTLSNHSSFDSSTNSLKKEKSLLKIDVSGHSTGGLNYDYPPINISNQPTIVDSNQPSSQLSNQSSSQSNTGDDTSVSSQSTDTLKSSLTKLQAIVANKYSRDFSPSTNVEDTNEDESSEEIALLEAQLEIARIEAKLLQLKKNKQKKTNSQNPSPNTTDSSSSNT
eukprot:CAMPEP_0196766830 /NCGR_PEP_ID=MMETSP1095-20130614/31016_1 /TAXON_ID=96789 ORGANISM="Chromulina nebulosa, Strain UTEXLB2642" /NCGR_SAMPLE_ID=MMETSP1095 /ASSEMBLY_ACC=CAM_ASM_000446 /LENGTH=1338 /DNA_ID=CAMNT_0042131159 /DNA_START=514 /DNA_END=4530 /DNA_ORIENTATION=-